MPGTELPTQRSDGELIAGARDDRSAFVALAQRHAARVFCYAFVLAGDRAAAQDIVTTTFRDAWAALLKAVPPEPIDAWLMSFARKRVRGRLRAQAGTASQDDYSDLDAPGQTMRGSALAFALSQLPAQERDALALNVCAGLAPPGVALALNMRLAQAEACQRRGLQSLATAQRCEPETALDALNLVASMAAPGPEFLKSLASSLASGAASDPRASPDDGAWSSHTLAPARGGVARIAVSFAALMALIVGVTVGMPRLIPFLPTPPTPPTTPISLPPSAPDIAPTPAGSEPVLGPLVIPVKVGKPVNDCDALPRQIRRHWPAPASPIAGELIGNAWGIPSPAKQRVGAIVAGAQQQDPVAQQAFALAPERAHIFASDFNKSARSPYSGTVVAIQRAVLTASVGSLVSIAIEHTEQIGARSVPVTTTLTFVGEPTVRVGDPVPAGSVVGDVTPTSEYDFEPFELSKRLNTHQVFLSMAYGDGERVDFDPLCAFAGRLRPEGKGWSTSAELSLNTFNGCALPCDMPRINGSIDGSEFSGRYVRSGPSARTLAILTAEMAWPLNTPAHAAEFVNGPWIALTAIPGTDIVAALDGEIGKIDMMPHGVGMRVEISHVNGLVTRYSNVFDIAVRAGERVARGQAIGHLAYSRPVTMPPLLFEIIWHGVRVSPYRVLPGMPVEEPAAPPPVSYVGDDYSYDHRLLSRISVIHAFREADGMSLRVSFSWYTPTLTTPAHGLLPTLQAGNRPLPLQRYMVAYRDITRHVEGAYLLVDTRFGIGAERGPLTLTFGGQSVALRPIEDVVVRHSVTSATPLTPTVGIHDFYSSNGHYNVVVCADLPTARDAAWAFGWRLRAGRDSTGSEAPASYLVANVDNPERPLTCAQIPTDTTLNGALGDTLEIERLALRSFEPVLPKTQQECEQLVAQRNRDRPADAQLDCLTYSRGFYFPETAAGHAPAVTFDPAGVNVVLQTVSGPWQFALAPLRDEPPVKLRRPVSDALTAFLSDPSQLRYISLKQLPVVAAADGVVVDVSTRPNDGLVRIRHVNGYTTAYRLIDSPSVRSGDSVTAGQVIGRMGQSNSAGAFVLMFELLELDTLRNPVLYFEEADP